MHGKIALLWKKQPLNANSRKCGKTLRSCVMRNVSLMHWSQMLEDKLFSKSTESVGRPRDFNVSLAVLEEKAILEKFCEIQIKLKRNHFMHLKQK